MFDLRKAVEDWQRPFQSNHIYSIDTIEELTHHLLDRYEEYSDQGMSEEVAFKAAVEVVGHEQFLRDEHRKEWKATAWYRRLLSLYRSEWQWIENPALRSLYMVGRLWTLGLGIWWLIFLRYSIKSVFLNFDRLFIQFDTWFYLQGRLLYTLLGLAAVFILVPFKSWTFKPENIFRVIFCTLVGYTAIHNLRIVYLDLPLSGGGEAFMWMVWLLLAPILWLVQTWGRRQVVGLGKQPERVLVAEKG